MQSNEARKFENPEEETGQEGATSRMETLLSEQLREAESKKVTTLEDSRKKNNEIRRLKETIRKLNEPTLTQEEISERRRRMLDASSSAIGELKTKRDNIVSEKKEEVRKSLWQRTLNFFGMGKDTSRDLDVMKARSEVKSAQRTQSLMANEYGKGAPAQATGPRIVPPLEVPASETPDTSAPNEDATLDIENPNSK